MSSTVPLPIRVARNAALMTAFPLLREAVTTCLRAARLRTIHQIRHEGRLPGLWGDFGQCIGGEAGACDGHPVCRVMVGGSLSKPTSVIPEGADCRQTAWF